MPLTTIITDRGRQILAARVPGDPPLASIKIAVGDGNGAMPAPNNAQLALVNERWRGVGAASINGTRIGFSANIPAGIGGFTIREIGVFIGPDGAEELAVVSQFGPQYKPAAGENGASSLTPVLYIDYTGSVVGAFTITLDANLIPVDPSVHRTVDGRLTAPPGAPADGSVYAIAAGATGDWAGKGGMIAKRRGTAWVYENPLPGHIVLVTGGDWYQKTGVDYALYRFPSAAHNHDDRYFTEAEVAALLAGKSDTGHNHDDRYYTEGEVNFLLGGKSDTGHAHDDRYYIEAEVNALLAGKVNKTGDNLTGPISVAYGSGYAEVKDGLIELARVGGAVIDLKDDGADDFDIRLQQLGDLLRLTGKLEITGDLTHRGNVYGHTSDLGRTFSSDPPGTVLQGGFLQLYGSTHPDHPKKVTLGNNGGWVLVVDAAGRVGIGTDVPTAKFDVNGHFCLRGSIVGPSSGHAFTISADPAGTVGAGGFVNFYGQTHATNPGRLSMGSGGVERLGIVAGGALALSGAFGANKQVIAANASGLAEWKSLSELGVGRKIVAVGPLGGGTTVVNFAELEPDTAYTGIGLYHVLLDAGGQNSTVFSVLPSSKTTAGCQFVNPVAPGSGTPAGLYIVYR